MFKTISHIDDVRTAVADVKEIKFNRQPNGVTIGCYMFMDSKTFDLPEAVECRGIAFDESGALVSRPLHKFFNMGEKAWLTPEALLAREAAGEVAAVFEKVDGSMIASAWINGRLEWRSKQRFNSDVVKLAKMYLAQPENLGTLEFSIEAAAMGLTVIFEITHPLARIVVAQEKPMMQLLHVRNNRTGEYILLNADHPIHDLIKRHKVPVVRKIDIDLTGALQSLESMSDQEGYVVQFKSGDMVKIKCPWYLRLHRAITFLRERDIAVLALNEGLDDVKGALTEAGIDLGLVNEVESRLKGILLGHYNEIEAVFEADKALDRKDFALKNKGHPLFGLLMAKYLGKEVPLVEWYGRNRLKEEFTLRVLTDGALAEAMEG
jgi:RNA ligase